MEQDRAAAGAAHAPSPFTLADWCDKVRARLPGIREVCVAERVEGGWSFAAASTGAGLAMAPYELAAHKSLETGQGVLAPLAQPAGELFEVIAYPLQEAGRSLVVLAGLGQMPARHVQLVMEQVQLSAGWVQWTLSREVAAQDRRRSEVAQGCFELLADMVQAPSSTHSLQSLCLEVAQRLGASRVAYASRTWWGGVKLRAISGQSRFDRRTQLNDLSEQAAAEAMVLRSPIEWRSDLRLNSPVQGLARLHSDAALTVIPLPDARNAFRSALLVHWTDPAAVTDLRAWSALWLLADPLQHLHQQARRNALAVLAGQVQELGRRLLGTGHYPLKASILGLAGLALSLALVQGQATLKAEATVHDSGRRVVSAAADGYLSKVMAVPGDWVEAGQPLAKLNDDHLRLKRLELLAQISRHGAERAIAFRDRDRGNVSVSGAQVDEVQARLGQVDKEIAQTEVRASVPGLVIEKDLRQRVGSRVEYGEVLFEIAPRHEAEIMLHVANRDAEEFKPGLRGQLRLAMAPQNALPIEVLRVKPAAESIDGELRFVGFARVVDVPPGLENGMTGVVRLDLGRRSLWDIWLQPVWDTITLFAWRWTP